MYLLEHPILNPGTSFTLPRAEFNLFTLRAPSGLGAQHDEASRVREGEPSSSVRPASMLAKQPNAQEPEAATSKGQYSAEMSAIPGSSRSTVGTVGTLTSGVGATVGLTVQGQSRDSGKDVL